MSKLDPRAPGMQWVSPYIIVKDAGKAVEFYEKAFGFTKRDAVPDESGKIVHAEMSWQGEVLMFGSEWFEGCPAQSPATTGVNSPIGVYVYCENVNELYKRAIQAGAVSIMEPQDLFWGDRMCKVADPDGHQWSFATHIKSD